MIARSGPGPSGRPASASSIVNMPASGSVVSVRTSSGALVSGPHGPVLPVVVPVPPVPPPPLADVLVEVEPPSPLVVTLVLVVELVPVLSLVVPDAPVPPPPPPQPIASAIMPMPRVPRFMARAYTAILDDPMAIDGPLGVAEIFGLSPLPQRAEEAWLAIRGDGSVPGTRFDGTTLRIFQPRLSVMTWLGHRRADRRIPIYNLFNHTPTPVEEGWSVRKTQVRDYRGGTLTYDSHNGTDFAIPTGTVVVAPAAGEVLRVSSEFNRGGLKIYLDHGRGLTTTHNHLGRALVRVGDVVRRGEPIALSGYSGIDAVVAFPWSVPHVHFNVWLDGEAVDPFAAAGETSIWREGNDPLPPRGVEDEPFTPTIWDARGVGDAIAACKDPATRDELRREPDLARRAMNVMFQRNVYPTRFGARPRLVAEDAREREPRLSIPFRAEDFVGITLDRGL